MPGVNEVILEYLIVAIFEADGERRPMRAKASWRRISNVESEFANCSTRLSSMGVANSVVSWADGGKLMYWVEEQGAGACNDGDGG